MSKDFVPLVSGCENTLAGGIIGQIHAIYAEIAEKQRWWLETAPEFSCPPACGECCVNFEPDLLEGEALYLASWMLINQRERAEAFSVLEEIPQIEEKKSGCVLHLADVGGSCGVYGGRALICRLFGYCGDTDRDKKVRFKICKFHPLGKSFPELKEYSDAELRFCFGRLPAVMGDFGSRTAAVTVESMGKTMPLRRALPIALRKLLMLERLNTGIFVFSSPETDFVASGEKSLELPRNTVLQFPLDSDDDNDTPNPTPTMPRAV